MLEPREHLALVVERHEERFECAPWAPVGREQVIGMAALRAAPHHFESLAFRYVLRAAARFAYVAEEIREWHTECRRERRERFEAGRHVAVLEPAQHRRADARALGDFAEREAHRIAQPPRR